MSRCLPLLFLAILFVSPAGADRNAVQKAYELSSRAMSLKFPPGVYSIRAPGFELFDAEGKKVDLELENKNLVSVLGAALKIRETPKIVSYSENGNRAHCTVEVRTNMRAIVPGKKHPVDYELSTICEDDWVLRDGHWMLQRSQVEKQELKAR